MSQPDISRTPAAGEAREYDYTLPPDHIAQQPAARRERARLLVLRRSDGSREHRYVADLPDLLRRGDLLVVNDTRVRHARLFGRKESGGEVEVLLLEALGRYPGGERWTGLVRASRAPRRGTTLFLDGGIVADVEDEAEERAGGRTRLWLQTSSGESVDQVLARHGAVPLPPYIHRDRVDARSAMDRERYQTVFAREVGSAAAPTAGLHLSRRLLGELERAGVRRVSLTLHVGIGTFQPIRAQRLADHRMHPEWCRLTPGTAEAIRETRRGGGRVVAVGTTVVRTLEARWGASGPVPGEGPVDLFLQPGHRFRAVDVLLTNFHLPRSTLLVLVAAFAGRERLLAAYREALEAGYRFYSYGDAMLIG